MKRYIKRILMCAVVLTWLGVLSTSQAATVGLGVISAGGTASATGTVSGSFNNNYTFQLDASVISAGAGTIFSTLTLFNTTILGFSSLDVSLTGPSGSGITQTGTGWGNDWSAIISSPIVESDYTINIKGQTNGSAGGVYSVGISAVPIPTAVILFGTGLLCLAGVARRKKSVLKGGWAS